MGVVPKLDRSREVLFLASRTMVFRQGDTGASATVIHDPPPADLARILAAVDGHRTVEQICELLDDDYDAESVVAVLTALRGVIITANETAAVVVPKDLTVIGNGQLASDLSAHFAARTSGVRLLWTGTEPPRVDGVAVKLVGPGEQVAALSGLPWVIAVHGEGTLGDAVALNRSALQSGTTCIHVLANSDAVVVGPTTVPFRTPCFECGRIFHYFEHHCADDAASAIVRLQVQPIDDVALRTALVADAAQRIAAELAGLRDGRPYPQMLHSVFSVSLRTGTRELELVATTQCESCHGCNPAGTTRGVSPAALPQLVPLDRSLPIVDRAGGVRSVGPVEARRRIEAAARALGIKITPRGYSERLEARYPELAQVPFVAAEVDREFRGDAPTFMGRLVPAYGKGISLEQALCSGMFEFFERQLAIYAGSVEIVRAAWNDVRDHAIDMEQLTEGLLDVPDRGTRVRFSGDIEIDWCWAQCLETGRPLLIPAETTFGSGFTRHSRPTCRFRGAHVELPWRGSSGASAGCTREDAVLQGLYEVLENDARNLQNRSGVAAPAISVQSIDDPLIVPLLQHVEAAGFELTLRYLTRDIKIPVVEAYISSKRDLTFHRVPGYGCHHDAAIAIRRAITEAIHTLGAAEATQRQTLRSSIYSVFNSFHDTQYCLGRTSGVIPFSELPKADPGWDHIVDYIDAAVAAIKQAMPDAQVCFYDFPMFGLEGVAVVGVMINGVYDASFHSELVPRRLRDAVKREQAFSVADLYLGELKT